MAEGTPKPGEMDDRILPWSQVKIISGLSRTTVWRLQKTGDFPPSVQVSRNRVGWWQSELLEWKRSRTPRQLPEPRYVPPPPPTPTTSMMKRAPGRPRKKPTVAIKKRARRQPTHPPEQGAFDF
ncbi:MULTISPECIES: helix-turn-helix transcriptional regulator [Brevundimonas]|uniref:helix-turn-helix transcriptional regulator n=1 Tax=Brevundimonas TaxID=41275 RepID=UPI00196ACCD5|nr:AlpA family phage regulatory protein [Brevundimonas lutea]